VSRAWLEQRERGTLLALRTITWITSTLGYRTGRVLLYPICAYFILFSVRARQASRDYLSRALDRPVRWSDVFRHYHTFAASLLDRVLMLSGRTEGFDIHFHGLDELRRYLGQGRGLLLLGSHLGSFEIIRALADDKRELVVNIVMHEANAANNRRWMQEMAPAITPRIIASGRIDTLLRVKECLDRGEAVAMLADRPIGKADAVTETFFGSPARFPSGPLRSAAVLQVPVILFFALYRGPRSYDVHFELLADRITNSRAVRAEAVAHEARRYAARLEAYARRAPYNWFNFYDFWREA
jgi:predicted LPLAT superfamily acyltransferase